jgi:hypothetical protein
MTGGLIFVEASPSLLDTPYKVGLFWKSDDQPDAEALLDKHQHSQPSQQASISPAGFEPAILAGKWLKTHALDCAATEI